MHIYPHCKQDWLRFLVFPFKAYVVIAPLLFSFSALFPRPPHSGPTDAEAFLIGSLFPCSLILFVAGFVFALAGPKGFAPPCFGFGALAFIIGCAVLPSFAIA
jgi:hypothetical protein